MRATFLHALLLLAAAAAAAAVFALIATPHGAPEAHSAPLRMPPDRGRSVVDARPAPGRPESSPAPAVRAPATPAPAPRAAVLPKPTTPRPRPRARARIVTVPGVVLTRAAPAERPPQLVRVKPRKPARPTRELAAVPEPEPTPLLPEAEPMHDNRLRWHPHE